MIMHMCMDIDAAEKMARAQAPYSHFDQQNIKQIFGLSSTEILSEIKELRSQGYTAIPSEGCDNHIGGRCQGHQSPRKVGPTASELHR